MSYSPQHSINFNSFKLYSNHTLFCRSFQLSVGYSFLHFLYILYKILKLKEPLKEHGDGKKYEMGENKIFQCFCKTLAIVLRSPGKCCIQTQNFLKSIDT